MLDFPRWKVLWLWALTIVGMLAAVPSLTSTVGLNWPSALPEPKINLGLDLAGGSHILLEADPTQVRQQRIEGMEESVRNKLRQSGDIRISDISNRDGALTFVVADPTKVDDVVKEWYEPSHQEFADISTVWRLFNAVTESLKGRLGSIINETRALHGICDSYVGLPVIEGEIVR